MAKKKRRTKNTPSKPGKLPTYVERPLVYVDRWEGTQAQKETVNPNPYAVMRWGKHA